MTRRGAVAALLVGLTLLTYANAMRAAFVWDDRPLILENAYVTGPGPLLAFWTRPDLIAGQELRGFRPLTLASFAVNYRLSGPSRTAFHLTSVAIHVLAVLGLWYLIRRALTWREPPDAASETAAALAAAVFAVHPALSQAVLFLTARSSLIAGAGVLWAAVCYARAVDPVAGGGRTAWGWYAAALGCWAAALSGKESALAGAILFVGIEWWQAVRPAPRAGLPGALVRLGIAAVAGVAYLMLVFVVVRAATTTPPARPYVMHLIGQAAAAWAYARLLVWPTGLALDHGAEHFALQWSWRATLGALVVLALAVVALRVRGRRPAATFGIASALIVIGPESYAVPLKIVVNEHRLYLPAACLAIALAAGLAPLLRRRSGRLVTALGAGVVALLSAATMLRVNVWRSPEALWRDAWAKHPTSCRAPAHLGQLALERGDAATAIARLEAALACNPERREPRVLLSTAYSRAGRHSQAIETARALAADFPRDSEAQSTLGTALARAGRVAEAIPLWERALALDPANAAAAANLARARETPLTEPK